MFAFDQRPTKMDTNTMKYCLCMLTMSWQSEPKVLIDAIGEYYKVKPGSDKEPDIYLRANIEKVQMPDGREVWATSPHDYIKNAIKTVKGLLVDDKEGYVLETKAKNPFPMNYQLELDVLNELGLELSSRYFSAHRYCEMGD